MNQQTDKLFRDKLEGFSKPVPSRAWEKVEKNLDKKTGLVIWWKIAAAVLLLATAAYILWPAKHDAGSIELSKNYKTQEPIKSNTPEQTPVIADKTQSDIEPDRKEDTKKIYKNQKAPVTQEIIEQRKPEEVVVIAEIVQQEIPAAENASQLSEVMQPETIVVQTAEPITQNITLVFRADDTDEYLDKKALAKATEEEEKASTFKKLLKKAKGLKNNQDPFGELRQKKNEILALNFKSEKEKRGQNK